MRRRITLTFEDRPDGGLRVYSDDVPGFVLSHPNRDAVLADLGPSLWAIIKDAPAPNPPAPKGPADLRDWFAGQAMISMAGNSVGDIAEASYKIADAMLAEREGRPPQ